MYRNNTTTLLTHLFQIHKNIYIITNSLLLHQTIPLYYILDDVDLYSIFINLVVIAFFVGWINTQCTYGAWIFVMNDDIAKLSAPLPTNHTLSFISITLTINRIQIHKDVKPSSYYSYYYLVNYLHPWWAIYLIPLYSGSGQITFTIVME